MNQISSRRGPLTSAGRRRLLSIAVAGVLIGAWFVILAPTAIGGPATLVLIDGHSMEPLLRTGDLAMAHRQSAYAVGDLVIVKVAPDQGVRTSVIHRIVSGSASEGWKTKGDNNDWVDPWVTPNSAVMGKYWASVPGAGNALAWINEHTWLFAGVCSLLALLLYLPRRRRRLAPVLRDAMATGAKEPRGDGHSRSESVSLVLTSLAALASLALVGLLGITHQLASPRGVIAAFCLCWAGGFTVYLAYRRYDGRGYPEPSRSRYALSGRLYRVPRFPALKDEPRDMESALALRSIAEKYRLPVLHRVDPETGGDEFLLITADVGAYRWSTARVVARREAAQLSNPPSTPAHRTSRGPRHASVGPSRSPAQPGWNGPRHAHG